MWISSYTILTQNELSNLIKCNRKSLTIFFRSIIIYLSMKLKRKTENLSKNMMMQRQLPICSFLKYNEQLKSQPNQKRR